MRLVTPTAPAAQLLRGPADNRGVTRRHSTLLLLGAITFGLGMLAVVLLLAGSIGGLDPELVARLESGDATAVAELEELIGKSIRFQREDQYAQEQYDVVLL